MPILAHPENPSTQFFIKILQTHFQSLQMHPPLPTQTYSKTNLNAFAPNFCQLILLIRFFFYLPRLRSWSIYIPAPVTEIHKLTSASESKQCSLDSILILFLKLCFNEVGLILTNLVNLSLSGGIFPSSLKQALVQPLLKNHLYPLIHWSISIHWWSQHLSSNFKPQLHFHNARKSRWFPHSFSPVLKLFVFCLICSPDLSFYWN